ncbi:MAG: hypothetical protein JXR31_00865 [Prolixibacteraceae bacterium]|nr:hypothetical protein [Prolixibacteraceae bacterium]MBN2772766.1 hypothetical protein [Prolixibacteraceae bacterium]
MKKLIFIVLTILLIVMQNSVSAVENPDDQATEKARIGIYDSRIIAVASTRTEEFMQTIQKMKSEHQDAISSGDTIQAKLLEKKGSTIQNIMHKQAFSTYPVTDILEKVKDKIPEVAEKANVSCIVNKWAIAYQNENIEYIDLTLELAALLTDSEEIKIMYSQFPEQPESLIEMEMAIAFGVTDNN